MTRQEVNKRILKELDRLVEKYPDMRFGQIVANYVFPEYREKDIFYIESERTLLDTILYSY